MASLATFTLSQAYIIRIFSTWIQAWLRPTPNLSPYRLRTRSCPNSSREYYSNYRATLRKVRQSVSFQSHSVSVSNHQMNETWRNTTTIQSQMSSLISKTAVSQRLISRTRTSTPQVISQAANPKQEEWVNLFSIGINSLKGHLWSRIYWMYFKTHRSLAVNEPRVRRPTSGPWSMATRMIWKTRRKTISRSRARMWQPLSRYSTRSKRSSRASKSKGRWGLRRNKISNS